LNSQHEQRPRECHRRCVSWSPLSGGIHVAPDNQPRIWRCVVSRPPSQSSLRMLSSIWARFHTHTHPPKRLAHPRSPMHPLSTLTSRATHEHPTSTRNTDFCAVWDCISSSSDPAPSCPGGCGGTASSVRDFKGKPGAEGGGTATGGAGTSHRGAGTLGGRPEHQLTAARDPNPGSRTVGRQNTGAGPGGTRARGGRRPYH